MAELTRLLTASLNFGIAAVGLGLGMLVLWQDVSRRTNQLFGVFLLGLGPYGLVSALNRYTAEFGIHMPTSLRISTILFVWVLSVLILFNLEFAHVSSLPPARRRTVRSFQGLTLLLAAGSSFYFGLADWFTPPHLTGAGHISYHTSTSTKGIMLLAIALLAISAAQLWSSPRPGSRSLRWPASLTLVGFAAFFIPPLEDLPMLSLTLAVVAVLMARAVLRLQLFDPLRQLNDELTAANNRLNATLQTLAATNAELSAANRRQSDFLARMSHDLRTPLNAIIGFSDMLLEQHYGPLTEKQSSRMENILRNSRDLLNLINDLLDLSRIKAGHLTLERKPCDPVKLLNSTLDTMRPLIESKSLTLQRDFHDLPRIMADEMRFRQIVTNLLSNAIKFTTAGGITVSAHAAEDTVCFIVRDTGIGIPAHALPHLFDEFYQVENSPSNVTGTGLGLAIVKRLVEVQQGRVWVDSTPGTGSTFSFTLPCAGTPQTTAETDA